MAQQHRTYRHPITVDPFIVYEGAALEHHIRERAGLRSRYRAERRSCPPSLRANLERNIRENEIGLAALFEARRMAIRVHRREVERLDRLADEMMAQQAADPEAPVWAVAS